MADIFPEERGPALPGLEPLPDPEQARQDILNVSADPQQEDATMELSKYLAEKTGMSPVFIHQNFDSVTTQFYGKKQANGVEKLQNTIKAEQINRQIAKLSFRQAALLDDSPETKQAIADLQKQLPDPDQQIKGLPGALIQQLYSLGYELPKEAYTGDLTDPKAPAVNKVVAGIASVLAWSSGIGTLIQGGRIVKDMNEQTIGASYRVSIDSGMDPTIARVQAGVTGLISDAMNTLQIGAAAGAGARIAQTAIGKTLLSKTMIRLGLEATQQEAIAFGMTLANKAVNEAGIEASNVWRSTDLPHKDFITILKEAGIEAQPMAIIGTGLASAGIAGGAFKIRKGSELEAKVRDFIEKAAEPVKPAEELMILRDTPEMTVEQKRVIYDQRIADTQAKVVEIKTRLETAKPEERAILEADLADFQQVLKTPFDVNAQFFAPTEGNQNVGDVLRAQETEPVKRELAKIEPFKASEPTGNRMDRETQSVEDYVAKDARTADAQEKIRDLEARLEGEKAKSAEKVGAAKEVAASQILQLKDAVASARKEANMVADLVKKDWQEKIAKAGVQAQASKSVNKMIKAIARINPDNLPDQYRDAVREVMDAFSTIRHSQKTIDRLTQIKKELETNPNAEVSRKDLERLGDLGKTPLRSLSVDDLRVIHDAVRMYAKLGMEEKFIKVGMQKMDTALAVQKADLEIPTRKQVEDRVVRSRPSAAKALRGAARSVVDFFGVDSTNFDRLAEMAGDTIYKVVFQGPHEGNLVREKFEQDGKVDFHGDIIPLIKKYGDLSRWMNEEAPAGNVYLKDGTSKPMVLTRAEHLALVMQAKNPQNRRHIVKGGFGFKWRPTERDIIYKLGKTPEEAAAALDKIVSNITPDEMTYIKAADKLLKKSGLALDEKFYDLNDVHLKLGDNYYHIETMPAGRGKEAEAEMAFNIFQSDWARIGPFKGMLIERVPEASNALYLNPIMYDLNRSLEHAAAYIGLEEPLRAASRLLYKSKATITQRLGERWYKDLVKGLKDIAGARDEIGFLEDKMVANRSNIAVATLGINVPSFLKQMLGLSHYTMYVKGTYLMRGFTDVLMHPKGVDRTHRIWSPEYVDRAEHGPSREVSDVLKHTGYGTFFGGRRKWQGRMMSGIQYFDRWTVKRGMQGAVLQALDDFRNGHLSDSVAKALEMTDADIPTTSEAKMAAAYKFADYVTERTQNMAQPEFMSSIQRGGPVDKMITLFASESSAAMNMRRRAIVEAKGSKNPVRAWSRVAKVMLITLVFDSIGSMLIDRAKKVAVGQKVDPMEKDLPYYIANQVVSGLPIVRDVANPLMRYGFLGHLSGSASLLPFQRVLDAAQNAGQGLIQMANADTDAKRRKYAWKATDAALEFTGLMAGIPYAPARNIVKTGINLLK